MQSALIDSSFRTDLWMASAVVAVFAAYVALDLAQGVRSNHRQAALRSMLGSALALATGIWATHFVALAAAPLPLRSGYHGAVVFAALVLAYAMALAGVAMGLFRASGLLRLALGAAVVGAAACVAPAVALLSLGLASAEMWHAGWLAAGWALAALAAGAALAIVDRQRDPEHQIDRRRHLVAALVLGGGMVAADSAVLAAAAAPVEVLSIGNWQVGSGTLTALATLGVPAILSLLLLSSVLDARFRGLLRDAREELHRAAFTDPLTDLPNRTRFEDSLHRAALRADRSEHRLALLFINLDGLKTVNESFGQSTGDTVLREMAKRLRDLVDPDDVVARAGGDEFLLLMKSDPAQDDAAHLAGRILGALSEPCLADEREVSITCSIGIAMYPQHGALSRLIAHATAAMRAAKGAGGATFGFFEERMVAGARDQVELLHDLRRAITQGQLELFYQPKIHAPSGQITGAEALMRWHHPQRGMVYPGLFIPLAERFGLIQGLGNWLIEDACRQIRAWRDQGLRMRVAINLSVHQLRQDDLVDRLRETLERHHVAPGLLTCEITESIAMDDTRATLAVLERLSALGVRLSIDDFGTGYSSLSYLRQLPAEELKIDRSFVLDLAASGDARAIVDAVIKLAQALGLKVVAEGVETEQQQEILRRLGCDELQGFLFAKPMSARALTLWAMTDEGPRSLDFRASLFGETQPDALDDGPALGGLPTMSA